MDNLKQLHKFVFLILLKDDRMGICQALEYALITFVEVSRPLSLVGNIPLPLDCFKKFLNILTKTISRYNHRKTENAPIVID